ncbi:MAG: beta-propeller domain-containing protein, partial [Patescibacteria group bacterium]
MKNTNFANGIYIFALVVLSILLVSCQVGVTDKGGKATTSVKGTQFESTQELKKFSSAQEVLDYIKGSQANAQYGGMFYGSGFGIGREMAVMAESAAPTAKSADSSGSAGGSAAGYSGTNIQVEGVDEADFVKNDGKYIYTLTQNKLVIVDAFPA